MANMTVLVPVSPTNEATERKTVGEGWEWRGEKQKGIVSNDEALLTNRRTRRDTPSSLKMKRAE